MTEVFLLDNGSLRPASTLNLRRVAGRLQARTGIEVSPVSVLHSNRVPPESLEGRPAEILEQALRERLGKGRTEFLVLPFFFGPSRAITDYVPQRAARLQETFPGLVLRMASPLVDSRDAGDDRIARILRDGIEEVLKPGERPAVAMTDHGSPVAEVAAVRDHVAHQVEALMGDRIERLSPASMERREGDAYAFNEPLLETLLDRPGYNCGRVVVSLLFLSPGRHAGPEGDIAGICREAEKRNPGLRTAMTAPVGEHDGILSVLEDRLREGMETR